MATKDTVIARLDHCLAVIVREGGRSSIPRRFGPISGGTAYWISWVPPWAVSGILGRPVKPGDDSLICPRFRTPPRLNLLPRLQLARQGEQFRGGRLDEARGLGGRFPPEIQFPRPPTRLCRLVR